METRTIEYKIDQKSYKGYLAWDPSIKGIRPGVLVAHAWQGLDSFAKNKAEELAKLGYIAFAVDIYGEGTTLATKEEAGQWMMPLFVDRAEIRKRLTAGLEVLKKQEGVDAKMIGAMGYCFGGMSVMELQRSGADIKAVVSFHALLGTKLGDVLAKTEPNAKEIKGALLILHGYLDPKVTKEDITKTEEEYTKAGIDWQMHVYGTAQHAFTNPQAKDPGIGLVYNELASKRSWDSMKYFFKEKLV